MKLLFKTVAILLLSFASQAGELEAVNLSQNAQDYHMPYNIVFNIITSEPNNKDVIQYEDAGDAALWTGMYLAAESFRYHVTRSETALAHLKRALLGIKTLSEVSGTGYLARSIFPVNGQWVEAYKQAEGGYGLKVVRLNGEDYYWQARNTRDQYAGVYFGLGVAYDYVDDQKVKAQVKDIVTRLTDYLIKSNWTLVTDGKISTTFIQKMDHQLAILKLAAHVNPEKFKSKYESKRTIGQVLAGTAIWFENLNEHSAYYKFNLNYMQTYNLLRLEPGNKNYQNAFKALRNRTKDHFNPFFNMIDRALTGANSARDAETRQMLEERLSRGFRNQSVDLRSKYKACDTNRACNPIPVWERPFDGFMWQRSPFTLFKEGDERIEGVGIDYTLPYWMGRAFGVITE